jgi:hypothetical protein
MTAWPRPNHYRLIYADPPWTFATYSRKGKGRSAEAYYDCMSLAEIKALPVADWAADDCVLLLWTTDPLLPTALDVIRSWGFTYKRRGASTAANPTRLIPGSKHSARDLISKCSLVRSSRAGMPGARRGLRLARSKHGDGLPTASLAPHSAAELNTR